MTLIATVLSAQNIRLGRVRRLLDIAERARRYGEAHAQARILFSTRLTVRDAADRLLSRNYAHTDRASRRFRQARHYAALAHAELTSGGAS